MYLLFPELFLFVNILIHLKFAFLQICSILYTGAGQGNGNN